MLPDSIHSRGEVINHSVGFGMAGVEAHEFAVADQVQSGELLRLQYCHDRISEHGPGAIANQP